MNTRRASAGPMRRSTNGPILAGIRPSRVSVKPNFAPSIATTTSQTDISPKPPPKALPCTRPISGLGKVSSADSIAASLALSRRRVALSISNCARIQPRSPPAQKLLPSAARTTTRTSSSAPSASAACASSSSICADMALCFSARASHNVATPRASVSTFNVSYMPVLPIGHHPPACPPVFEYPDHPVDKPHFGQNCQGTAKNHAFPPKRP